MPCLTLNGLQKYDDQTWNTNNKKHLVLESDVDLHFIDLNTT